MRRDMWLFVIALSLLSSLVGCDGEGELKVLTETPTPKGSATPAASPTSTEVTTVEASPTPTPETPTPSPSSTPTATATATVTPEPQETDEPRAIRIQFAPGATSARVTGNLEADGSRRYVVRALGGQVMEVSLLTPSSSARLSIWGADGTVLKDYEEGGVGWRGELPSTQDYFLEVSGPQGTSYTLEVNIPLPTPQSPIRVISPNGGERWLEGETVAIVWRAPDVDRVDIAAALGGKDRGFIVTDVPASEGRYTWTIPTGFVSDFGIAESNAVRIRVSDSMNPNIYDENDAPFTIACPRIRFAPGATSATLEGDLAPSSADRYVLEALSGQSMELSISPTDIEMMVAGEGGSSWKTSDGSLVIDRLPATQDYFITLALAEGSPATDYTLEVHIPAP
ncbi:MAG: hypothetical protein ACLFV5_08625 [Anaerolineales bacterium]